MDPGRGRTVVVNSVELSEHHNPQLHTISVDRVKIPLGLHMCAVVPFSERKPPPRSENVDLRGNHL